MGDFSRIRAWSKRARMVIWKALFAEGKIGFPDLIGQDDDSGLKNGRFFLFGKPTEG